MLMNYAQQQRATPRKIGGITAVVLLHVVMVYGLITGSAHRVIEAVSQPLMTKIIQETKPPDLPPPPPPPPKVAAPPPPFIPMPEIQVRQPVVSKAITQVTTTKPVEAPPPVAAPVAAPQPAPAVRVPPVIDAAHACRKPEYPSISRRLEETGTVVLNFLIDLDGKVVDSNVAQSSGKNRLDEAARQALALCNFKPGTVDGKPEKSWAQIRYTWTLN